MKFLFSITFFGFVGVTRLERLKGVKDKVKQTRWAQRQSGSGVRVRGLGSGSGSGRVRAGGVEVGAQQAPRLLVYDI